MILEDLDFTDFFKHIEGIFCNHFSAEETKNIMEFVYILADANFRCYVANAVVIDIRKSGTKDYESIAAMEWVARSVGEYRVASKANINRFIHNVRTSKEIPSLENWMSDDIVYSVGEMMDRLSIETIKREDFNTNKRPAHMIESSKKLSGRVETYLIQKLEEVDRKGFYECVHEQRTYDLEGILEELVI